jgi:hypothetical protein
MHYVRNIQKKIVLFNREYAKSWTYLTIREKNMETHINPSPNKKALILMAIEKDIKIQKMQIIDTIAKSSKILHALLI